MSGETGGREDDRWVDPAEVYERLNESFYSTSPARYFEQRLNNLLVAAVADPRYSEPLRAGITLGDKRWVVDEGEHIASHQSPEDLRRFLTAESLVLHSHTAETLLQLFIAHRGLPPCPLFTMTKLQIGAFFIEVEALSKSETWTADVRAKTSEVFLGAQARPEGHEQTEEVWSTTLDRICTWIRHLAGELDTNRPFYNASKHGFGANPSEAMIQFLDENQNLLVSHEGPSLEALTWSKWRDNVRTWSLTTRWYEPREVWAEISTAIDLMDSVWQVGRMRYCASERELIYVPGINPVDVWRPRQVNTFTTPPLLIETRPSKAAQVRP